MDLRDREDRYPNASFNSVAIPCVRKERTLRTSVSHFRIFETSPTIDEMVFDDTIPSYRGERFVKCDWSEFYPDAMEAIPDNMPEARGKEVTMSCFVDADHAGCRETRRSHSGILLFVNRAPIMWYSKRQNTVEASTYGSELLAMRLAIKMIEGLRYKFG